MQRIKSTLKTILLVSTVLVALYFLISAELPVLIERLQALVEENYVLAFLVLFSSLLFVCAFNIPCSGALTVGAGMAFGFWHGLLLASFASSVGATLSMLMARHYFRSWVERRFDTFAAKVERGLEQEGTYYLFMLRLIPGSPFFVVNPVFGLSNLPVWKFYLVSQLGLIPVQAIYVNLGSTVSSLDEVSMFSVFTPKVLMAFALLITFPLFVKWILGRFKQRAERTN